MLSILNNQTYRRLFAAQIIALTGTGLLTVALGLMAFDLAGARAGAVLGTIYAIKMVSYVAIAPVANALITRLPRKAVLISADIARALVALCLPFVDAVWQAYVLIFVLQSASATFTPTFQAVIPDILKEEADYTRALSLSRLAYDLESLVSPALAGLLLLVMSYHGLFVGTVFGFVGSALLVARAAVPDPLTAAAARQQKRSFRERLARGSRIYLATPRLRGLLALNMAAAAAGAFVIVNTVVLVQGTYGGTSGAVAGALAAFGAGSMLAALAMPGLLESARDRQVMITAAGLLALVTLAHGLYLSSGGLLGWNAFLALWVLTGLLYSAILTPSGRLLRRSAHSEDRAAVFAAQFALSHMCWLLTYPVAGWVGNIFGLGAALLVLGGIAALSVLFAHAIWPRESQEVMSHSHPDLAPDHPHLAAHKLHGKHHRHVFVIDDEHRVWPTSG